MKRTLAFLVSALSVLAAPPAPEPGRAGMDAAQLKRIAPVLQEFVDRGQMSGAVTLVARRGALAHFEATGWQDAEAKKPMQKDTIFQIMSMTKPFTGVAILMLAEEGKLRLHDRVEDHLPEFRGQMVIESEKDGVRVLRKPSRPITIRDLMTHTSGLGQAAPGIGDIMVRMDRTLAEACLIYSQQPLLFDPGTRWMYSNPGIAVLGRIVEVRSGMSFEQFLETRIFQPLGMTDTHVFLPPAKRPRLAPVYTVREGRLVKAGDDILGGDPLKYREGARYSGPEHSLYSTAWDLAQFYQMMLNGGEWNGRRLLAPSSVELMTRLHTGELAAGHNPGTGFGLTWEVTKDAAGTLTGQSIGTYGHGGAFGTYGWVDPQKKLVGVFLTQLTGRPVLPMRDAFITMTNAAVREAAQ
ncbi:MAG: beta-lactamase family protein [Bryobacteraceae bacterium]|nr:beta-lactamase family protein [Bryobacteraceae bacterium]MCX7604095.1 beta-lactamase family protein [Bryobacteraceae bacterium]